MRNGSRDGGGLCCGWNRRKGKSRRSVILTVVAAFLLVVAPLACGATYTATNTDDSGSGSLRQAILDAEAAGGGTVDATGITGTILLDSTLAIQTGPITISGPGADQLAISGQDACTVFQIDASASAVAISGLTIENGSTTRGGGGIHNSGSVTIENCTFDGNSAGDWDAGGGIFNSGSVTIENCTFDGNSTGDFSEGGGIYNSGSATIENCTFSKNVAVYGGGMYNDTASPTVTNCTFNGNSANTGGGMCNYNGSSPTVTDCTFSGNDATFDGGGIYSGSESTIALGATIAAGNTAPSGPDIYGTVNSAGYNLVNDATDATGLDPVSTGGTDLIGVDPMLGPLADNGGPVWTCALLPGSPAIDAVPAAGFPGGTTDARGVTRPQGSACDIGAFESQGFTLSIESGNDQSANINTAFAHHLVVGVTSTHGEPVDGGEVTFSAPGSGASATLSGNPAPINSEAANVTATANGVGGSYTVDAKVRGATSVSFTLTNSNAKIAVKGNGHAIASGDATPTTADGSAFGSADIVTGTVDHTFTIESSGTAPLELTGSPKITISGTNASDFTVTAQPDSPVAANSTTTFTIEFDPSASGTRTATVSIANNSRTNPYTFAISGTGSVYDGDVNGDGVINILDMRLCQEIAEDVIPGTATQREQADIDGDGQVTIADAQQLAQFVMTH